MSSGSESLARDARSGPERDQSLPGLVWIELVRIELEPPRRHVLRQFEDQAPAAVTVRREPESRIMPRLGRFQVDRVVVTVLSAKAKGEGAQVDDGASKVAHRHVDSHEPIGSPRLCG